MTVHCPLCDAFRRRRRWSSTLWEFLIVACFTFSILSSDPMPSAATASNLPLVHQRIDRCSACQAARKQNSRYHVWPYKVNTKYILLIIQYNTIQYNTIQYNTIRVYFDSDKYMHDYVQQSKKHCEYNKLCNSIVLYIENNIFLSVGKYRIRQNVNLLKNGQCQGDSN